MVTNLTKMASYEDDDLVDYDNDEFVDEFDEDYLNDEDYEKLYTSLEELKKKTQAYNRDIDDIDLKQALYYNYYDVSAAYDEIKSKFPKKVPEETVRKIKKNFDKPSPDDEVAEHQKNAFTNKMDSLTLSGNSTAKMDSKQKKSRKSTGPFKKINLQLELEKKALLKPQKSFVVIGHVDVGKSTLMGRILFDSGTVDAKLVNNLVRQSERVGKGSFALAWVMDQTEEERSRGVTIDICETWFETNNTRYTAIDAPGHRDFVPQAINGISQSDIALVVVDAVDGEFETGFDKTGQTKEHTLLAKNLGIEYFCIVVNKMDREHWSQDRYELIKLNMLEYLTGSELNLSEDKIQFIPLSGLTGNNVIKRDDTISDFSWYKGPSLIQYLENLKLADPNGSFKLSNVMSQKFSCCINDVYEASNTEFAVTGKIYSGLIQAGESICFAPSDQFVQIQSINLQGKDSSLCSVGDVASFKFKKSAFESGNLDDILVGDLLLGSNSLVTSVHKFKAKITLFNLEKPLLIGTPFVCFRNTSHASAQISQIIQLIGSTKKPKRHLNSGQSALVEIELTDKRALPITRYIDDRHLGRIVLRREGSTIGAGTVSDY